jgi:L-serine dehydratase
MNSRTEKAKHSVAGFFIRLSAYAVAASEENAAGHRIVTAPTAGSAGVLPALARTLKDLDYGAQALREGLLAAAAVGFLAKHNASIAGAEVGCQGEIGVASAMGAALLADAWGDSPGLVEDSAAIALEHHLGLTCDPVGGYVQIPCIERCAMGAVKAATAFLIAAAQPPGANKVGYDAVVQAMAETGRDMSSKYKETARGGLAAHLVNC